MLATYLDISVYFRTLVSFCGRYFCISRIVSSVQNTWIHTQSTDAGTNAEWTNMGWLHIYPLRLMFCVLTTSSEVAGPVHNQLGQCFPTPLPFIVASRKQNTYSFTFVECWCLFRSM